MKYIRYRHHKVNAGQGTYESHDFGATVEFDDQVDTLPPEYKPEEIQEYLEDTLDDLLAIPAQRAVTSGVIDDSHIYDYYEIN